MGKLKGKYIKIVIVISLLCFVFINIFPYDIIGIMIENSKENAELKDSYLLVRKGYEESLDSLGVYEVVRESDEEEFYLLRKGELTDKGVDSMYMELNGKDYNNMFMLDTPDYSGEFNIQKGKLHRAANRDLIVNTTATVLLTASTILGLAVTDSNGFAQTDKSERINILLLAIPYAVLSGIAMFQSIRDVKIKNKKPETAESIYDGFMRGVSAKEVIPRNLNALEILLTNTILMNYSYWVIEKYSSIIPIDNLYFVTGLLENKELLTTSFIHYLSGLTFLNTIRLHQFAEKYYNEGMRYGRNR